MNLPQDLFEKWCELTDAHPNLTHSDALRRAAVEVGVQPTHDESLLGTALRLIQAYTKQQKGPKN